MADALGVPVNADLFIGTTAILADLGWPSGFGPAFGPRGQGLMALFLAD